MDSTSRKGRIGWAHLQSLRPAKARVLVVDDDARIRKALLRALVDMGHTVRVAASAEEADQWLTTERFQVALLDIDLPRMSGVEFLSWALKRDAEMAVIMVTGHDEVELALQCMSAGARTYLVKPVVMDFLRTAVNDALALRHLLTSYNDAQGL